MKMSFYFFVTDTKGNIFLGAGSGLYYKPLHDSLKDVHLPYRITSLALDQQGYLWAGTWNSGLYRVKVKNKGNQVEFEKQDLSGLITDKHIRGIFVDKKGYIWIGTRYDGIFRLRPTQDSQWEKINWSRVDGLSSNWINTFAEDSSGNIWVGTHGGLNKMIPEKNGYRIFNFNKLNNVFGDVHCIYIGKNNTIWCGGYPGLVRLRDEQVDTLHPLPLFLTNVKAGKIQLPNQTDVIKLKHDNNSIYFEFSTPGYINERNVLYSYRLLGGADSSWSTASNINNVSFASIEPGQYTFQARTYGWNGQPGEIKSFSFTISPPYWKTWWFYLILGVVVAILLYSIYKYRIRQLIKWQKARDRIASDLHDDIGSSLTNISILSELSSKHLHQPDQASRFLKRISEEVNSSSQAMDDIIWSVNSQNDSLEETLSRMRRLTAELFDGSEIEYHLQLDETVQGIKLNMEQRRDTFLLYKEILNNIYKHANASKAWITVKLNGQNLHLNIRDDGKGFNVNMITHRNGLKNIYSRAGKWNGQVDIESYEGAGTEITISLPLTE